MRHLFDIGGIPLALEGDGLFGGALPPNLRPFAVESSMDGVVSAAATLRVSFSDDGCSSLPSEPLSVSVNDLGVVSLYRDGDGWLVAVAPVPGEPPRVMRMDGGFASGELRLRRGDRFAAFVIDSVLRILFSQAAVMHGALMLHASAVELDGAGFLFMGKSGTGKSTHSRLWMDGFPGCRLINDDNPLVRLDADGRPWVCGTPWSGKAPCWRAVETPLCGVARLVQASVNRFVSLGGIEAFVAILPGISVMTADPALYDKACSLALRLLGSVATARLECLPDAEAARLCRKGFSAHLTQENNNNTHILR